MGTRDKDMGYLQIGLKYLLNKGVFKISFSVLESLYDLLVVPFIFLRKFV